MDDNPLQLRAPTAGANSWHCRCGLGGVCHLILSPGADRVLGWARWGLPVSDLQ